MESSESPCGFRCIIVFFSMLFLLLSMGPSSCDPNLSFRFPLFFFVFPSPQSSSTAAGSSSHSSLLKESSLAGAQQNQHPNSSSATSEEQQRIKIFRLAMLLYISILNHHFLKGELLPPKHPKSLHAQLTSAIRILVERKTLSSYGRRRLQRLYAEAQGNPLFSVSSPGESGDGASMKSPSTDQKERSTAGGEEESESDADTSDATDRDRRRKGQKKRTKSKSKRTSNKGDEEDEEGRATDGSPGSSDPSSSVNVNPLDFLSPDAPIGGGWRSVESLCVVQIMLEAFLLKVKSGLSQWRNDYTSPIWENFLQLLSFLRELAGQTTHSPGRLASPRPVPQSSFDPGHSQMPSPGSPPGQGGSGLDISRRWFDRDRLKRSLPLLNVSLLDLIISVLESLKLEELDIGTSTFGMAKQERKLAFSHVRQSLEYLGFFRRAQLNALRQRERERLEWIAAQHAVQAIRERRRLQALEQERRKKAKRGSSAAEEKRVEAGEGGEREDKTELGTEKGRSEPKEIPAVVLQSPMYAPRGVWGAVKGHVPEDYVLGPLPGSYSGLDEELMSFAEDLVGNFKPSAAVGRRGRGTEDEEEESDSSLDSPTSEGLDSERLSEPLSSTEDEAEEEEREDFLGTPTSSSSDAAEEEEERKQEEEKKGFPSRGNAEEDSDFPHPPSSASDSDDYQGEIWLQTEDEEDGFGLSGRGLEFSSSHFPPPRNIRQVTNLDNFVSVRPGSGDSHLTESSPEHSLGHHQRHRFSEPSRLPRHPSPHHHVHQKNPEPSAEGISDFPASLLELPDGHNNNAALHSPVVAAHSSAFASSLGSPRSSSLAIPGGGMQL